MSYLLDTNSFVEYLRQGPSSKVAARVATAPPLSIYLCSVVLGELLYGVHHAPPQHQAAGFALIGQLRIEFRSLPFDDRAAEEYGKLREYLTAQGKIIGPNDLKIAAIALANQLTVVTQNTSEFSRVPGLTVETWH